MVETEARSVGTWREPALSEARMWPVPRASLQPPHPTACCRPHLPLNITGLALHIFSKLSGTDTSSPGATTGEVTEAGPTTPTGGTQAVPGLSGNTASIRKTQARHPAPQAKVRPASTSATTRPHPPHTHGRTQVLESLSEATSTFKVTWSNLSHQMTPSPLHIPDRGQASAFANSFGIRELTTVQGP